MSTLPRSRFNAYQRAKPGQLPPHQEAAESEGQRRPLETLVYGVSRRSGLPTLWTMQKVHGKDRTTLHVAWHPVSAAMEEEVRGGSPGTCLLPTVCQEGGYSCSSSGMLGWVASQASPLSCEKHVLPGIIL